MMLPLTPCPNTPPRSFHKKNRAVRWNRGREEGEHLWRSANYWEISDRMGFGMDGPQILFQVPVPVVVLLFSSPPALLFYSAMWILWGRAKHACLMSIKAKEETVMSGLTQDGRHALWNAPSLLELG